MVSINRQDFCTYARIYEKEMYNICKAILLYEKDCCDVMQEALIKAYNKMHTLKEDKRQIIILHYVNGYSIDEISELLKIPQGTVKSRLFNARNELKKSYKEVMYL